MVSSGSSLRSSLRAASLPAKALIQMHTAGMSGYQGKDFTSSRAPCRGVRVCKHHHCRQSACLGHASLQRLPWHMP